MTNIPGALKSATRAISPDSAIDAESSSAGQDMRRLIFASFLATRDIFREAAIAGTAAARPNPGTNLSIKSINVLATADGGYLKGTGDFIVVSRTVVALNLTQMIAVPVALVCLLLIVMGLRLARKMIKVDGKPGRFQHFALYASGLQAAQLYRLLDQALAGRGREPIWANEMGRAPFVCTSSPTELPVPELQVAANNDGNVPRIVMGLRGQPQHASPEGSPKERTTTNAEELSATPDR
ncbi:hypothetical protein BDZ91DRAFT_71398 [Kalaharituber pfeilii]|nr:hypothetical protein BDZ91DRAFT_71398 [Kalaharituber pfeilii]